jgi:hypothetical protein
MIVEWYGLKIAFLSSFITWYVCKKWNDYNTCKAFELKSFLIRREK